MFLMCKIYEGGGGRGGERCLKFEEKGKILDLGAVSNRHLGLKKIEI